MFVFVGSHFVFILMKCSSADWLAAQENRLWVSDTLCWRGRTAVKETGFVWYHELNRYVHCK